MNQLVTFTLSIVVFILAGLALQQSGQPDNPPQAVQQREQLKGAWQLSSGAAQFASLPEGATAVALMEDGYFTVAYFDAAARKFIGTYGGTYTLEDGQLTQHFEFNTLDTAVVGTTDTLTYTLQNGQLQLKGKQLVQTWAKAGNTTSPLEGTWRITARAGEDGKMNPMQRGPRKTLKILSGNRFQWIAFNTDTKEFSGTGGGTYTAGNGKYAETIEFFSRDSSRVGATLNFDYKVQDGNWLHSGQSTSGKKISEVWERGKTSSSTSK